MVKHESILIINETREDKDRVQKKNFFLILLIYIRFYLDTNVSVPKDSLIPIPLQSIMCYLKVDIIRAAILNLKNRAQEPQIRECDYAQITCLILNHYFPLTSKWCLATEQVTVDNYKPDFTVSRISTTLMDYGTTYPYLTCEVKKAAIMSWQKLMNDQLWRQSNEVKQPNGKI